MHVGEEVGLTVGVVRVCALGLRQDVTVLETRAAHVVVNAICGGQVFVCGIGEANDAVV